MTRFVLAPMVLLVVAGCATGDSPADTASASAPSAASAAAAEDEATTDSVATLMSAGSPLGVGQGQVRLVISKSSERAGSFSGAGPIRTCGATAGGKDFTVSFAASGPTAPQHPLQKLAFHAVDLAPGSSTTSFTLDATIQDLDMRKMELRQLPALALEPGTSGTGTATLTNTNGVMRLELAGRTDRDEEIALTVRCNTP